MKRNKKVSLLKYWSKRYLITLVSGLIIIGILSTLMINYYSTVRRLDIMKLVAEEIADRAVDYDGNLRVNFLPRVLERRENFIRPESKPIYLILDKNKKVIFTKPDGLSSDFLNRIIPMIKDTNNVDVIDLFRGGKFYLIERRIENNNKVLGSVVILFPKNRITLDFEQFNLLIILLVTLGVLGWIVLYLLTRKLSEPIKDVADAAKQIVEGNYDIHFNKNIKEKEIYELVQSFKDMANRLSQLERMRTELLAGVTHELKTPVTSISALIQAVRDEVVSEEEAKEFLEISSKETKRLQKMVEDLLDFNSFEVGAIKVNKEDHNLNELIKEITYQWGIVQEDEVIKLNTIVPNHIIKINTDSVRLQQILFNLLNNSKQALIKGGEIEVSLYEENNEVKIDVKDNGVGILAEEQYLIFERFYRGKDKKNRVHGLGLGLSFSKIVARALNGDLVLKESSKNGTTFTIILFRE